MVDCKTGSASINFWDEENRLRLAVNPKFVGYYGYDANGERVYKLTGSTQYDDLNGSNPSFGIIFDGLTVYPSPYIVLTEKQYTKHYYAGTEKIATMIGDGGLLLAANHISNEQRSLIKDGFYRSFEPTAFQYEKTPNIDIEGKYQSQLEYACGYIDQANLYLMSNFPMLEPMMQIWQNSNGCRNEIYYTHGDHLGSANWITDADGKPIQYIHYAPYGELIANKQTIGYDERFKFTGKERDWETGYDYFGARFYDHRKGFWNSVDPLADKYPSNTPYLYCNGNPIMLVDPDGRKIKGISSDDVDCFIEDVSTILSDTKYQGFCALLQRDKRSVQKIDMDALEAWSKGTELSEDEKTFIDLLVSTINSNKTIRVEYIANNNASVSPIGNLFICNALPFLKTSDGLIAQTDGALTVSTHKGAYCLMAITGNIISRAINSMHEVLGHGVALCVGAETLDNNSQAIRVENLIRRLTQQPQFNGHGHAEPYDNVYELPILHL